MAEGAKSSWKDEVVRYCPVDTFDFGVHSRALKVGLIVGLSSFQKLPTGIFTALELQFQPVLVCGAQAFLRGNDMSFKLSRRSLDRLEGN